MKVSSVLPGYLCLAWFKWNHDEVRVLRKILLIWDTEHRTLRKVWNMWTRIHLCSEAEAWLTKSTQSWTFSVGEIWGGSNFLKLNNHLTIQNIIRGKQKPQKQGYNLGQRRPALSLWTMGKLHGMVIFPKRYDNSPWIFRSNNQKKHEIKQRFSRRKKTQTKVDF